MPQWPFAVVIPLFNRALLVADALRPFLSEPHAGLEVIVVDDGSTDDGPAVAERLAAESRGASIRVVRQANAGPGAARNTGAALARTDWLAFLDSDDCWFPWTARILRETIERHPDAGLVFLALHRFATTPELATAADGPAERLAHRSYGAFAARPASIVHGSGNMAIRRALFEQLGGFDPGLRNGEDMDLFYRAEGKCAVVEVRAPPAVGWRSGRGDQLTGNPEEGVRSLAHRARGLRAGAYPDLGDGALELAFARSLVTWARIRFSEGHPRHAWRTLALAPALVIRHLGLGVWLKTALTPVLALVRPRTYRFRWSPRG